MNRRSVIVNQGSIGNVPLWLGVGVVAVALSGFLMYDLGQSKAGFNRSVARDELDAAKSRSAELEAANKTLSERIAVLETAAKVDREAYRQVDEELAALQSRILDQQEDIEFYRGIVGKDDGSQLRIQNFRVTPERAERAYELRLVLAQALRSNSEIAGQVELTVEGLQRSEPMVLRLSDLGQAANALEYSFLYFEEIKISISLPVDFEPQRVGVRVKPRGNSAKTVEESFVWQPETS